MPKLRHEAVVEILQNEPKLVLQLLEIAGAPQPFGSRVRVTVADSDLSDRDAADDDCGPVLTLISDNVFVFAGGRVKIAVVAEVQTGAPAKDRTLSWPAYAANARARHKCDSLLLVFAINADAARGSAKTILTGHPGWDLKPLVCGIGRTPGIPPEGGRFAAELVLLRLITGELKLSRHDERMFALAVIAGAPLPRRLRYARYIRALAPTRARRRLEELMRTLPVLKDEFFDGLIEEGLAKGLEQGLEQGRLEKGSEMLLKLLDKRFTVPASIRRRVTKCDDDAQINAWFDRAVNAPSLDAVFAKLPSAKLVPCCQASVASRAHGEHGSRQTVG